jgi:hypothetical protein
MTKNNSKTKVKQTHIKRIYINFIFEKNHVKMIGNIKNTLSQLLKLNSNKRIQTPLLFSLLSLQSTRINQLKQKRDSKEQKPLPVLSCCDSITKAKVDETPLLYKG